MIDMGNNRNVSNILHKLPVKLGAKLLIFELKVTMRHVFIIFATHCSISKRGNKGIYHAKPQVKFLTFAKTFNFQLSTFNLITYLCSLKELFYYIKNWNYVFRFS